MPGRPRRPATCVALLIPQLQAVQGALAVPRAYKLDFERRAPFAHFEIVFEPPGVADQIAVFVDGIVPELSGTAHLFVIWQVPPPGAELHTHPFAASLLQRLTYFFQRVSNYPER